jgi:hypothetical protein
MGAAPPLPRITSEKAAPPDEISRRIIADFGKELRHTLSMGSEPLKLQEKLAAEYYARWEAVETVKAQELAALTEERARDIIRTLRFFAPTPPNPMNGMGLVEQQAIFQRGVAK